MPTVVPALAYSTLRTSGHVKKHNSRAYMAARTLAGLVITFVKHGRYPKK